jgi:CubicO group peptidase (beta-lactamase class C family)
MKWMLRAVCIVLLVVLSSAAVWAQEEDTYSDPAGNFTAPIPTNWTAETLEDGFALFRAPEDSILIYVTVVEGDDLEAAITEYWSQIFPDVAYAPLQTQTPPNPPDIEEIRVDTQLNDDQSVVYQAVVQRDDEMIHLLFVQAEIVAAQERSAQINTLLTGMTFVGLDTVDLSTAEPLPIDEAMLDTFSAYIEGLLAELEVPGVAVAVVDNGEIVFEQGFGVRELGTDDPVTPETLMMIGSTTKSMTTMMMGTLVDEGLMEWDTPAVEVLPTFAVSDPAITEQITMRNLVCACTGVPRRDLEFIFNASELTAEDMVESLRSFRFFTEFGETFQYSNQMVAAGGYLATVAGGGTYGDLYPAYLDLMQTRIFDPMGMGSTTFDFEAVAASADYALPHGATLEGVYEPLPLTLEQTLVPVAPAGLAWSNAQDMAQYLITLLNRGAAADGTRVVSEANLLETWEPQVDVSATSAYGLGWFVDAYKGVPVIHHGGNTLGFTTDLAFLPDHGIGIVVMSNGQLANLLTEGIRARLLELLYEQPMEYDATIDFAMEQGETAFAELQDSFTELDAEAVEPYLGTLTNEALGEATLTLEDGVLMFDVGEFRVALQPTTNDEGEVRYTMAAPPLTGVPLELALEGDMATLILDIGTDVYTFTWESA